MKKFDLSALKAVCSPRKNEGKVRVLTDISIYLGSEKIAARKVAGNASEKWALSEYLKNPNSFEKVVPA